MKRWCTHTLTSQHLSVVLLVVMMGVNALAQEPRYQGRTAAEWAARLSDSRALYRTEAAFALSQLGPAAATEVPALMAALSDSETDVRWYSAMALSAIGPKAEPAVAALVERLSDDNRSVRYWAGQALGRIGPAAKAAVPALRAALADPDWRVRRSVVFALRGVREHAAPAVGELSKLLGQIDPDEFNVSQLVRAETAELLGQLGAVASEALPALEQAARTDPSENVRQAARQAISQIRRLSARP